MPAFLTRLPPNLSILQWKSSDWRAWIQQLSIPCMQGIVKAKYLNNWARFVEICRVMVQEEKSDVDLANLRLSVERFLTQFREYYGNTTRR